MLQTQIPTINPTNSRSAGVSKTPALRDQFSDPVYDRIWELYEERDRVGTASLGRLAEIAFAIEEETQIIARTLQDRERANASQVRS